MDPIVIAGLSIVGLKLAAPVVDTICGVMGSYAKPVAQVLGDVHAQRIKEKCALERQRLQSEAQVSKEARAQLTHLERIEQKQENLEAVVMQAIQLLSHMREDGQPPMSEWNSAFQECAEDADSDELQTLWANILATEYDKPGTVSKRVLKIVKEITKEEAVLFNRFLEISVDGRFILTPRRAIGQPLGYAGIKIPQIVQMVNIGLLASEQQFELEPQPWNIGSEPISASLLKFKNYTFVVYTAPYVGHKVSMLQLSEAGQALYNVLRPDENIAAIKEILISTLDENHKIAYARQAENGQFQFLIPKMEAVDFENLQSLRERFTDQT